MMTYRSSYNPPDKTDYSNFAFKKSEILDILKILNSNFSFDEHLKENDPKSYKDFFYKLTKITKHAKRHFWLNDVCTCHGLLPSHSA